MLKEYFYNLANDKAKGIIAFFLKAFLLLLSLVYSLLVRIVGFAYKINILKVRRLSCKVISIGNITWGGTGKTPIVEMVAKKLLETGHKLAIQSRGYKRKNKEAIGDEPNMLQDNLNIPVIVGENRLKEARLALKKFNLDTIILDDGFQQWRIFRDMDIVVIDAMNPFGNGCLIPRGILREPLISLKRADIFFLTHTDLASNNLGPIKQRLREINPKVHIVESRHAPLGLYNILDNDKRIINEGLLKDKNLGLVTAIGNPDSFEKTLLNLGLNISLKFIFLDHHEFIKEDFKEIISQCLKEGISTIVTTQKDAVKLKDYCLALNNFEVFVLRIQIKITENEGIFFNRLFGLYSR